MSDFSDDACSEHEASLLRVIMADSYAEGAAAERKRWREAVHEALDPNCPLCGGSDLLCTVGHHDKLSALMAEGEEIK